ncbi:hypothetical protein RU639_013605 [Aspergillus parasiticus]
MSSKSLVPPKFCALSHVPAAIIGDTTTDKGATVANTTAKAVIRDDISDILEITSSLARTTLQENQPYVFLNTAIGVADAVEELFELPADPPSLYLDLEGTNHSRHGSILILQIFVLPHNRTYLIDIHTLKENAFAKAASNGQTLKKLLEAESVPKVFSDARNDSDALYNCFGIKLA